MVSMSKVPADIIRCVLCIKKKYFGQVPQLRKVSQIFSEVNLLISQRPSADLSQPQKWVPTTNNSAESATPTCEIHCNLFCKPACLSGFIASFYSASDESCLYNRDICLIDADYYQYSICFAWMTLDCTLVTDSQYLVKHFDMLISW